MRSRCCSTTKPSPSKTRRRQRRTRSLQDAALHSACRIAWSSSSAQSRPPAARHLRQDACQTERRPANLTAQWRNADRPTSRSTSTRSALGSRQKPTAAVGSSAERCSMKGCVHFSSGVWSFPRTGKGKRSSGKAVPSARSAPGSSWRGPSLGSAKMCIGTSNGFVQFATRSRMASTTISTFLISQSLATVAI
jgi:hypothetical protein